MLLGLAGLWRMLGMYRGLESDLEALLPESSPAVSALHTLRQRFSGTQHLGIVIRGPRVGPPAELAEKLGERLARYPRDLVRAVKVDVAEEREFVREHEALYLSIADVREVRRRVEEQIDLAMERDGPFALSLEDDVEAPIAVDFSDIEQRYADVAAFTGKESDRLVSKDGRTAVVLVFAALTETGTARSGPLFEHVKADVAELTPPASGLEVGYAGDIAINVEELAALKSDLTISAVIVLLVVGASIVAFFRWWSALWLLGVPVVIGTATAFGLCSFWIPSLNTSTAFLGSIVVGNGINSAIMLLSRYREERGTGIGVAIAIQRALSGVWRGTLAAALSAAAGGVALWFTGFRGFSQFGMLSAAGMLACWAATFVLIPALITLCDRDDSQRWSNNLSEKPRGPIRFSSKVIVAVALLVALSSIITIERARGSLLEHDLTKLRRKDSAIRGEALWGRRLNEALGRNLTYLVVLCDRSESLDQLAPRLRELRKEPPLSQVTSRLITPEELVPRDQAEKLGELRALDARLTPRFVARLSPEHRKRLDDFRAALRQGPITPAALPELLSQGLREKDGTFGRTLVIEQAVTGDATWDGPAIIDSVRALEGVARSVSPPAQVAGGFVVSASVLEAVQKDAVLTSLLVLGAIFPVVMLTFRRLDRFVLVLGSLVFGVLLMMATGILLGLRVNALNFVVFPITFGVGIEYAINVMQRFAEHPREGAATARRVGAAVALCSFTTIVGYGSLLVAENQALFSFGELAVIGEVTCLLSAVLVLPAAWEVLHERTISGRR